MADRRFGAAVYAGLKAATRSFIETAFGRQKIAAAATRVGQQAISDYGSAADGAVETFMPIDVLLDLTAASGDTSLLKEIADQVDCLLVRLPKGEGNAALIERSSQSAEEFGLLMSQVFTALADRRLTEREAKQLLATIRTLMLDLAGMAEAVEAATERDAP